MSFGSDQQSGASISAANLLLEYRHFIDSHEPLSTLNQADPAWAAMVSYCQELESYQDLMASITKLHTSSQIDFERALFCSWMSLLVARYLNLAEPHQKSLFFAGLLQDLGKHSVQDDVKQFVVKANPSESAMLKAANCEDVHPLVSSTYIERTLQSREISDLILHHHARYDGTGYPQRLSESQLDLDHQILIIANDISDQLDQLGGHNHLEKCIPMLHLSSFLYFQKANLAWHEFLSTHFEFKSEFETIERANLVLRSRKIKLQKLLSGLISLSGELLRYDFDLSVHGLRMIIQKLAHMFTDTGVLNKHIFCEENLATSAVLNEMEAIFRGMPEILRRCDHFVEELLITKRFNVDPVILAETRSMLESIITELGNKKPSVFR